MPGSYPVVGGRRAASPGAPGTRREAGCGDGQRRAGRRGSTRLGASFWRLFTASTGSNLSDGVLQAALPLVAASLTRDPVLVSLVATLAFLPWLLFAIPAGALVDRLDRRRAMQAANVVRAAVLVALAAALASGLGSIWLVYAAAFLLGVAETVYDNAARALLPRVVTRAQLERGNSLLATAESVSNLFVGAPLGALLFAFWPVLPLGVSVAVYLGAALLIVTVRGRFAPERATGATLAGEIRVGLSWLVHHPILSRLVWVTGLGAFANALTTGIGVLFVLDVLGIGEAGFGLLLSALGVGAVLGSWLSPLLTRLLGRTTAMGLAGTVAGLALVVAGAWPVAWVSFLAWPLGSAAIGAFNVQVMSVRQVLIPDVLFGRVQGAYRTVLWGSIPLGSVSGGFLGAWLGLPAVFVVGGLLATTSGLATWWVLARHAGTIAAAFRDEPGTVG